MQQPSPDVAPAPATPAPAPPAPPAQPGQPGQPADVAPAVAGGPATAQQMYVAAQAQRRELREQLDRLEDRRRDLSNQLQVETLDQADRAGLQKRLSDVDARIADVEKQIAQSDLNVAQTAALPGAVPPDPPPVNSGDDEEEAVFATLGITTPFWLAVIYILRRRWRRGGAGPGASKDLGAQLTRVEQAVESIALEVERIGEAQRFTARVLAEREDQRALGAGAAEPVQVRQREAAPERKR